MANYTFYPTIPSTNNNPSSDQPNMQTNNQSINDWSAVDHVGYNVENGGTHLQVTIPTPLGSDPSVSGTTGEIYTKLSGIVQLFFRNSTVISQITGVTTSTTGASAGITGFKLSNGVIINYQLSTSFLRAGQDYIFQTTYPYTSFFIVLPILLGGPFSSSTPATLSVDKNNGLLGFKGYTSTVGGGGNAVDWIAIGV